MWLWDFSGTQTKHDPADLNLEQFDTALAADSIIWSE